MCIMHLVKKQLRAKTGGFERAFGVVTHSGSSKKAGGDFKSVRNLRIKAIFIAKSTLQTRRK